MALSPDLLKLPCLQPTVFGCRAWAPAARVGRNPSRVRELSIVTHGYNCLDDKVLVLFYTWYSLMPGQGTRGLDLATMPNRGVASFLTPARPLSEVLKDLQLPLRLHSCAVHRAKLGEQPAKVGGST